MAEPEFPVVVYAIDRDDHLVEVDENWLEFAVQNAAPVNLRPENVLGTSLWSHIRDETLRAMYEHLIRTVRESGESAEFDFRCDSPLLRRYMRMTVSPLPADAIQFVSTTMKTAKRDAGLTARAAFAGNRHVIRCSVCNLFRLNDGSWSEVKALLEEDRILDDDQRLKEIWSVCSKCRGTVFD